MTATILYRLLAAGLIAGMAGENLFVRHKPANVQNYHTQIRAAATQVPSHIGPWIGKDVPVLARALNLLSPNVMISRNYTNVQNGQALGFLAEHCSDAHDMVGLYPLRCYPADGWDLQSSRPLDWQVGDRTMVGMEYTFVMPAPSAGETAHTITIENFLLRPNGHVLRDMDSLTASILGAQGQASGAGQLQLYFNDCTLTPEQRQAIFQDFMTAYRPLVDAILADIPS
jgi:hypothetical protein